jgi:drug/metabolite transporter (DMT)-like permease
MRSIGGVVGGQVGAAFLAAYTIAGTSLPAEKGFIITFTVGAIAALLGAALAVRVPEPRRLTAVRMEG